MNRDDNPMRRGAHRLKNGALAGDPRTAPRCGARTRAGTPCRGPAMPNGRRRMNGGRSTGPKAPRTRHGGYGRDMQELMRRMGRLIRDADAALAEQDPAPATPDGATA